MPMVHRGLQTLVRYPDGDSRVITLYVAPVAGQVIAHGWEVTSVAPGAAGDSEPPVEYDISVARPASEARSKGGR